MVQTRSRRRQGVKATGIDQIFPQLKRSLALFGVAILLLCPGMFIDTRNYTGGLTDHFLEHTPPPPSPGLFAHIRMSIVEIHRDAQRSIQGAHRQSLQYRPTFAL